jgi:hypothetical protein
MAGGEEMGGDFIIRRPQNKAGLEYYKINRDGIFKTQAKKQLTPNQGRGKKRRMSGLNRNCFREL